MSVTKNSPDTCTSIFKYVVVFGLIVTGIVFFSINENKEEWPLPEVIVTHSIVRLHFAHDALGVGKKRQMQSYIEAADTCTCSHI